MRIIACIPARYQSSRLPGKPLRDIAGKPMIAHVMERASAVQGLDDVVCLTDDERIYQTVTELGFKACMTSENCRCGTDRIIDYIQQGHDADVFVNIQGDEVLLEPKRIEALIQPFRDDARLKMGTLAHWETDADTIRSYSSAKIVTDLHGHALYFSRQAIPCTQSGELPEKALIQTGVYIYRKETLEKLATLPPSPLENTEKLEQLRALENQIPIKIVVTEATQSLSVDTEQELEAARAFFEKTQALPA